MQNTLDCVSASMVKELIDKFKSDEKVIPKDLFNLALFVHDTIGDRVDSNHQRDVYNALANELKLQLNKGKGCNDVIDEEQCVPSEEDKNLTYFFKTPNTDSDVCCSNPLDDLTINDKVTDVDISNDTNGSSSGRSLPTDTESSQSNGHSITNLSDISSVEECSNTAYIKQYDRNKHSSPKLRKGDSLINEYITVCAYVLIDEAIRCPDPKSPVASQIRFKVEYLNYLQPWEPFYQYEMAERHIEDSDLLSSSLQESIVCFTKAASGFVKQGLFRMAANCYVRIADCFRATDRFDDVGKCLVTASKLHQKERSDNEEGRHAAMTAMQHAVNMFQSLGRVLTAAKLSAEAAELCIKAGNPGLGIDILHLAQETMLKYGQSKNARQYLLRATEIAVMDFSDFKEAIDCLEKIARLPPIDTAYLSYFRALLCRIVCVPVEGGADTCEAIMDVKKVFEEYMDMCPRLSYGSERKLLLTLIDALKTLNEDAVEKEIVKYVSSHESSVELWLKLVLKRILVNIKTRNAVIMQMYSNIKSIL